MATTFFLMTGRATRAKRVPLSADAISNLKQKVVSGSVSRPENRSDENLPPEARRGYRLGSKSSRMDIDDCSFVEVFLGKRSQSCFEDLSQVKRGRQEADMQNNDSVSSVGNIRSSRMDVDREPLLGKHNCDEYKEVSIAKRTRHVPESINTPTVGNGSEGDLTSHIVNIKRSMEQGLKPCDKKNKKSPIMNVTGGKRNASEDVCTRHKKTWVVTPEGSEDPIYVEIPPDDGSEYLPDEVLVEPAGSELWCREID